MQIALLLSSSSTTRVSPSTLLLVPSVTNTGSSSRSSSPHSIAFHCSKNNSFTALIQRTSPCSKRIVKLHSASDKNQLQTEIGGGAGSSGDGRKGGGGGGGGGGDNSGDNNEEEEEEEKEGSSNSKKKKQMAMSMSQKLTLGYAALVGVGGVMGYVKSGSQKSVAAGGLCSLLLYYVYTELPIRPAFASSLGLGVSAALLVLMGSRFKKSGKVFPAGVVSLISFVMTGGYLHGILRSQHA